MFQGVEMTYPGEKWSYLRMNQRWDCIPDISKSGNTRGIIFVYFLKVSQLRGKPLFTKENDVLGQILIAGHVINPYRNEVEMLDFRFLISRRKRRRCGFEFTPSASERALKDFARGKRQITYAPHTFENLVVSFVVLFLPRCKT